MWNFSIKKEDKQQTPEDLYYQGNRYLESQDRSKATEYWYQARELWSGSKIATRPGHKLKALVLFLVLVLGLYIWIYSAFPRHFTLEELLSAGMSGATRNDRSFLERWLDTGREKPQYGRYGIEDFWKGLRQRLGLEGGEEGQGGGSLAGLPQMNKSLEERWVEMLNSYGKMNGESLDLDPATISGDGLSAYEGYDEAIAVLEKAIAESTDKVKLADLYQSLAYLYYWKGYRQQPDGTAGYRLDDIKKATQAYEKSLEYQQRGLSHGNLGWMYFLLGEYEKSELHSLLALQINPSLLYVQLNLGLTYLMEYRNDESYAAYVQVIRQNPSPEVYFGGITDLREIIRDNPGQYPFAHFLIGLLSLNEGNLHRAKTELTQYTQMVTGGEYYNQSLQMLEQMQGL